MTKLLSFILLSLVISVSNAADLEYSVESIVKWEHKSFSGKTSYLIERDDDLQQNVIVADSSNTASGLFYEEKINLNKTPWLRWSWRVEELPDVGDEQKKSGDDFAARIYVVVKGGIAFWRTKAINYVWSSKMPVDSIWPNAYAGKSAMMIALQHGAAKTGWVHEKRNIKNDLKKLFGKSYKYIDAIAIMTDTDDSKSSAKSYYSNIKFTEN